MFGAVVIQAHSLQKTREFFRLPVSEKVSVFLQPATPRLKFFSISVYLKKVGRSTGRDSVDRLVDRRYTAGLLAILN